MKGSSWSWSILPVLLLPLSLVSQQPAARVTFEGLVVDSETGKPLERVTVLRASDAQAVRTLELQALNPNDIFLRNQKVDPAAIRQAETDQSGRFLIENLDPGRIPFRLSLPGYVPRTLTFSLNSENALRNVTIRLKPTGVMAGRIIDSNGRPAVGIRVFASAYVDDGVSKKLETVGVTRTNDLGQYRLLELPGNEYLISACSCSQNLWNAVEPSGDVRSALHPGVRDLARATFTRLDPGTEVQLTDLTITSTPTGSIRIRSNAPSEISRMEFIQIQTPWGDTVVRRDLPPPSTPVEPWITYAPPTPGLYRIMASYRDSAGQENSASTTINFTGEDIDGALTFAKPQSLVAKIYEESIGTNQARPLGSVTLVVGSGRGVTRTDGSATIPRLQRGVYAIDDVIGLSPDMRIGSARQGERDAIAEGVLVEEATPALEIRVQSGTGVIEGTVTDSTGTPIQDATVKLALPGVDSFFHPVIAAYQTDRTDQAGAFRLQGIIPGKYVVYAQRPESSSKYLNAKDRATIMSTLHAVDVPEGGHLSIELKPIGDLQGR